MRLYVTQIPTGFIISFSPPVDCVPDLHVRSKLPDIVPMQNYFKYHIHYYSNTGTFKKCENIFV